jgi:hypothetical protein
MTSSTHGARLSSATGLRDICQATVVRRRHGVYFPDDNRNRTWAKPFVAACAGHSDKCFDQIFVNETLMAVCASVVDTAWQNALLAVKCCYL